MAERNFVPPVRAVDGGFALHFDDDERGLLVRLMGELRELLTDDETNPLLDRLFPTAYPDDEEKEAEYQRLMREELVSSRLGAIDVVVAVVGPGAPEVLDESQTLAFMQSVNALRLVLGSMLGITDDESAEDADASDTAEHHLYSFLSWVLEWSVRALSH